MGLVLASSMDRQQLDDFELPRAARRRHLDRVAFLLVQERAADRRRRRDQSLGRVGVFGHHELKDQLLAGALDDVQRRSEAGAIGRDAIDVEQRDLRHALLQHADARLDQPLALLGRVVLGVLAQVAQLARAQDFPRQLDLQLAIERVNLVLELLDQPLFHRFRHGTGTSYHSAILPACPPSRAARTRSSRAFAHAARARAPTAAARRRASRRGSARRRHSHPRGRAGQRSVRSNSSDADDRLGGATARLDVRRRHRRPPPSCRRSARCDRRARSWRSPSGPSHRRTGRGLPATRPLVVIAMRRAGSGQRRRDRARRRSRRRDRRRLRRRVRRSVRLEGASRVDGQRLRLPIARPSRQPRSDRRRPAPRLPHRRHRAARRPAALRGGSARPDRRF